MRDRPNRQRGGGEEEKANFVAPGLTRRGKTIPDKSKEQSRDSPHPTPLLPPPLPLPTHPPQHLPFDS